MKKAYKTKLKLNNKERGYMAQCAGSSRAVYNWAWRYCREQYTATGKSDSPKNAVKKYLNSVKDEEMPWLRELPYTVLESAMLDLQDAYDRFFSGQNRPPSRKKKHKSRDSFRLVNVSGNLRLENDGRIIRTPLSGSKDALHKKLRISGRFRLCEAIQLPPEAVIKSATFSRSGNDWYVSILVDQNEPEPQNVHTAVVGVDAGVRSLAVSFTSGGKATHLPTADTAKLDRRIALLNQKLSRQTRFSNGWRKTKAQLRAAYHKRTNKRQTARHEASAYIIKKIRPGRVVIEDLNVKGMMTAPKPKQDEATGEYLPNGRAAKRGLSRSLAGAGLGELKRQIMYKAEWAGVTVIQADRFYPSSKTCSGCGEVVKKLSLAQRVFECPACGLVMDRDENAAANLSRYKDAPATPKKKPRKIKKGKTDEFLGTT